MVNDFLNVGLTCSKPSDIGFVNVQPSEADAMNMFLLGWNLPSKLIPTALDELRKLTNIYPDLDPRSVWSLGHDSHVFAASIHTSTSFASPRKYVHQDEHQVTLFDGCLVDPSGQIAAHNAKALSENWLELPNVLEGQFVVVRVCESPPSIELVCDPLGVCQVFYTRLGNTCLISNSVHLLSRITRSKEFDPLGASLFLTLGWAGGDRTLRKGIRVIPGGQIWTWCGRSGGPNKKTYFDRAHLLRNRKHKLSKADVKNLGDELVKTFKELTGSFGTVECPITGGRDSRIMTALLLRDGLQAQYYTGGALESSDVKIGGEIAKHFDLPYIQAATSLAESNAQSNPLIEDWENISWRLVNQCDGMVSLSLIGNALYTPLIEGRLIVHLYGGGGEIARGFYGSSNLFLRDNSLESIREYMLPRLLKSRTKLVREAALGLTENFIRDFSECAVEEGFPPIDIPDLFYTYERARRWGGANFRSYTSQADVFSPFDTRKFIEAAFAIPALQRYTEHVHFQLSKYLVPRLHQIPLEKAWPIQQPKINLYYLPLQNMMKKAWSRATRIPGHRTNSSKPVRSLGLWAQQHSRLEAKKPNLRELCLDQSSSPLWDYVDRTEFERVLSDKSTVRKMGHSPKEIFDIVTLFQYALT